jgi:cell division cycle protein 20 (cofactor of APC complex)
MEFAHHSLTQEDSLSEAEDHALQSYKNTLANTLFEDKKCNTVLGTSLRSPNTQQPPNSPPTPLSRQASLRGVYQQNKKRNFQKPAVRNIPTKEERILDAPGMLDDFYLHLLSWSGCNLLAVALQNNVYIWNAETGSAHHLCGLADDQPQRYYSSLEWSVQDNNILALSNGPPENEIELWDAVAGAQVTTLRGQAHRVGVLSWSGHVVASGARDGTVMLHDPRTQSRVCQMTPHMGEVCGLSWSPDGQQLASGGNDNLVQLFDINRMDTPRCTLRGHTAAVKALGWSPHQSNLLASGGGTEDTTLRFWNTMTGACTHSVYTTSQICCLLWSKHSNEIVTSHGFSDYQLTIWKFPSMQSLAELKGHAARVLHLAISPDGQTVVSAAADETIRFWKCFAKQDEGHGIKSPKSLMGDTVSRLSESALMIR